MSLLADISSPALPAVKTGWQLFHPLATGMMTPGRAWRNPAYRRKFLLRSLLAPVSTAKLLSSLAALPEVVPLLYIQPGLPCRLHRPWLARTVDKKTALAALTFHYQTFFASLPPAARAAFFSAQGVPLAELCGKADERYRITLVADAQLDKEGEATLIFSDAAHTRLAEMTFTLCHYHNQRTLFIGGLQGAKVNVPHESIQSATKSCHGLFPKRLLLEAATTVAALLDAQQIVAVSNATHIYQSWRYRRKKQGKLLADYDSFWQSMGGERNAEGHFLLPASIPRKPMEEIASKKRAEYRRRYALLESLHAQITQTLSR